MGLVAEGQVSAFMRMMQIVAILVIIAFVVAVFPPEDEE